MIDYVFDWIGLFFRWFHVIAGVAWIGASFYFIWLDNHLETPPVWKQKKGIKGDLWAIHGGGFYEVAKYHLGPEQMPKTLHWFKWEAYTTWLTGVALLIIVYYANAQSYMLMPTSAITNPNMSILAGLGIIAIAVIGYELLLRSLIPKDSLYFAVCMVAILSCLTWLAFYLLSPRAAYIHIGAAIGSIMVGNVFWGIIPAQRHFVSAVQASQAPNELKVMRARLRSLHNNYFTLPVIFIMVSNHAPFVYANDLGWLWLICIGVITAYVRHYFNLKHRGIHQPWILITTFATIILLVIVMKPAKLTIAKLDDVTDAQVMTIVSKHCMGCHATQPAQIGLNAPPAGIVLETSQQLRQFSQRILRVAVYSTMMPIGNLTGMTDEEREALGTWLLNKNIED